MGNLANLQDLFLHGNQLSGEIPPELGNLTNLTWLDLSFNQLSGEIPPELGNLANLTGLFLGGNQLTGCVPNSLLGRLVLYSDLGGLQFCGLGGTTTPSLDPGTSEGDRAALVALYATVGPNWDSNDNWLSDVPISEWSGVTTDDNGRVTGLDLRQNQLSGEIPPELGNLASLEILDLSDNRLSGCVPSRLSGRLNMHNSALDNLQFCP